MSPMRFLATRRWHPPSLFFHVIPLALAFCRLRLPGVSRSPRSIPILLASQLLIHPPSAVLTPRHPRPVIVLCGIFFIPTVRNSVMPSTLAVVQGTATIARSSWSRDRGSSSLPSLETRNPLVSLRVPLGWCFPVPIFHCLVMFRLSLYIRLISWMGTRVSSFDRLCGLSWPLALVDACDSFSHTARAFFCSGCAFEPETTRVERLFMRFSSSLPLLWKSPRSFSAYSSASVVASYLLSSPLSCLCRGTHPCHHNPMFLLLRPQYDLARALFMPAVSVFCFLSVLLFSPSGVPLRHIFGCYGFNYSLASAERVSHDRSSVPVAKARGIVSPKR